jgi:uncharacterized protein
MPPSDLTHVKETILDFLKDQEVAVFLFGSRARGNFLSGSDIDIGLIPKKRFEPRKIVLLRELLENMNIPFKVDIVDFSSVSESFKQETLKEAQWWRD